MVVWCVRHSNVLTTAWNITELRAVDRSHHHIIITSQEARGWALHFTSSQVEGDHSRGQWSLYYVESVQGDEWLCSVSVYVSSGRRPADDWEAGVWWAVEAHAAMQFPPSRHAETHPHQHSLLHSSAVHPGKHHHRRMIHFSCSRSSGFFTKVHRASIHLLQRYLNIYLATKVIHKMYLLIKILIFQKSSWSHMFLLHI